MKMCMVAEGLADVYPRFAPTMEWDTAAGQAVVEAAGFSMLEKESRLPLQYNKENLLNPSFYCSLTQEASKTCIVSLPFQFSN